jgi:hypothetical protein
MSSIVSTDILFRRVGLDLLPPSPPNPFYNLGKHSAPQNAASKEGVPTVFGGIVLLVLINGFATSRTKSNMNPPSAVPDVTETDT